MNDLRIYKEYRFFVRTKIPFSELPALIERYLESLDLQYQSFLYEFTDLDPSAHYMRTGSECKKRSACQRALADCPALGPLSFRTEESGFTCHRLTNLSSPGKEAHDLVMPLMTKIHRRYGFSETFLCYHGINFFSRSCPTSINASLGWMKGVEGPYIMLQRWSAFSEQDIILHVDITDGQEILDASPYLNAMTALLPGTRYTESIQIQLTAQEQAALDEIQKRAASTSAAVSAFFDSQFKTASGKDSGRAVSLAPSLKRLCRQYSYRYLGSMSRVYSTDKQTANGHLLRMEFDTGQMGDEVNVSIVLEGLGFSQRLAYVGYLPENQKDAESHLHKLFLVLNEAESKYLSELDQIFPPSPEWFASAQSF